MLPKKKPVDKVRASRDGHEYHEIWVARKSLELLNPNSKLMAIAVEGLSPADQASANSEEVEIADVVLYYGGKSFKNSEKVSVLQFKYSIARKNKAITFSDTQKTLSKFADAYKSSIKRFGKNAPKKLIFQFITNRPISNNLIKAIQNIINNKRNTGKNLAIANQFKAATKLKGNQLKEFASICEFLNYTKNLSTSKNELENTLISLSATSDNVASSRLGKLKDLVREKAGTSGDRKNLIERTDLFAALSVRDLNDLLPCPENLSDWGQTLTREQTGSAIKTISSSKKAVLIHAAGGVGKTVFMKNLSGKFADANEVVFFDCFGGGAYRSTEGARHLAKHGLIHIANTLAFKGLCDPILPNTPDEQALIKAFRHRLEQCLETLKKVKRKIYIFIDAIDNAEYIAKKNKEKSFSKILLESFYENPIDGVRLVVSCRTERKPDTDAKYDEIELSAFSKNETASFLKIRNDSSTNKFIDSAFARSAGNARVLDYLIEGNQGVSKVYSKLKLDDLLSKKIDKAIDSAKVRGSSEKELTTFLSGLTLLTPPVIIADYAAANRANPKAIKSMVSDLAPLLELSAHGVIFKDEPTETLIIKKYGSKKEDLKKIAKNLIALQGKSAFAAHTLPELLYKLQDGKAIYSLAEDNRIPNSIESDVAKLKIKYARLKTAAKYAAEKKDFNKLIGFLVEISSLAEFDQRGLNYLLSHPVLVVELNDLDAIRRIYESTTEWPGTRHASLAIIHTLKGELEEAHEHAFSLHEWVDHFCRMDEKSHFNSKANMNASDCVAEPLFILAKKRPQDAAAYFSRWKDWYSFEIAKELYCHLSTAIEKKIISKDDLSVFHNNIQNAGALAAALFFHNFPDKDRKALLKKLVSILNKKSIEFQRDWSSRKNFLFQKCFLFASLSAVRANENSSAKIILETLGNQRPRVFTFTDRYSYDTFLVEFVIREVLRSIIAGKDVTILDLLPQELFAFGKNIKIKDEKKFLEELNYEVENYLKESKGKNESNPIIRESDKNSTDEFLTRRLPQLRTFADLLRKLLSPKNTKTEQHFTALIKLWEETSKNQSNHYTNQLDHLWLQVGFELIIFSLFTLKNPKVEILDNLLTSKNLGNVSLSSKKNLLYAIAHLLPNSDLAEKIATELSKQVQLENDVTTRASYFADIGKSLLVVNKEEAIEYFKKGLLSVDAIGSGDYRYVNELLIFAASLHGKEMSPAEFHSLSNICEINMNEEPHKFYWEPYGAAFSRIAGLRGLAQLSRWDDRQKIGLSYTLLPYLIPLVRDKKLKAKDAIALNYLANPAEYRTSGTTEFVETLSSSNITAQEAKELIHQFLLNNSGTPMSSTVKALAELAEKVLGKNAPETIELNKMIPVYRELIDKSNRHSNLHSSIDSDKFKIQQEKTKKNDEKAILKIIKKTNPTNKDSFKASLKSLNLLDRPHDIKDIYFSSLRKKVKYKNRKAYIENLASIEDGEFHWYWILEELSNSFKQWASSSLSLKETFKKAGVSLLHQHSVHLIGSDYLSHRDLDEISKFSGISIADLTLELVKVASQHDIIGSGAVWLSIATLLNERAANDVAQSALKKLLASESTKLGEMASDGKFNANLCPPSNTVKIIAGLIWKTLGSHDAKERWRATHSIRCFAKFDRWDVISELVGMITKRDAGPFQCADIKFYDYHARLWLLIALARIAKEHPKKIASYKSRILSFTKMDHVLFRHFSAMALIECHNADPSFLTKNELNRLLQINKTSRPLVNESRTRRNSYQGRPDSEPKAKHEIYFEYDFKKYKIDTLGRVFNIDCWKMDDLIAETAKSIDRDVTGHTDTGNKQLYRRYDRATPTEDTYGEQIIWHSLYITAGKLLSNNSVNKSDWEENSWEDWFKYHLLTRDDGYWQSDTLDIIPLEIKAILREEAKGKLVITEKQERLLELANVADKSPKDIVIDGHWTSQDGITVSISSALAPKKLSNKAVASLSKEGPFHVWIPDLNGEDESDRFGAKDDNGLFPWIVSIESDRKLDKFDPYGADVGRDRSRVTKEIIEKYKLSCHGNFQRYWRDETGENILKSEIWRGPAIDRRDEEHAGIRLSCSSVFLKKLLKDSGANLIILIHLRQYLERDYKRTSGEFIHSVGIVEINEELEVKYFKGCNQDSK